MWRIYGKGLKDCLSEVADEVCGRTKGPARHEKTWWWNEEIEKVVKEKRRLYGIWYKTRTDLDKKVYFKVRGEAKRVIAKAKAIERLNLGEMLERKMRNVIYSGLPNRW
jgi:hypothetical protein